MEASVKEEPRQELLDGEVFADVQEFVQIDVSLKGAQTKTKVTLADLRVTDGEPLQKGRKVRVVAEFVVTDAHVPLKMKNGFAVPGKAKLPLQLLEIQRLEVLESLLLKPKAVEAVDEPAEEPAEGASEDPFFDCCPHCGGVDDEHTPDCMTQFPND